MALTVSAVVACGHWPKIFAPARKGFVEVAVEGSEATIIKRGVVFPGTLVPLDFLREVAIYYTANFCCIFRR